MVVPVSQLEESAGERPLLSGRLPDGAGEALSSTLSLCLFHPEPWLLAARITFTSRRSGRGDRTVLPGSTLNSETCWLLRLTLSPLEGGTGGLSGNTAELPGEEGDR